MESKATETQDERICRTAHNLAVLVKEQKAWVQESKQLCLEAFEVLLAHPDFFCDDFNRQLAEEKQTHLGELEAESSDGSELGKHSEYVARIENEKAEIWNRLDGCTPELQRDILEALLAELPEKEREYEEEVAAREACDEFINLVYQELPTTEQTIIYKNLLEQAKSNGLMSLKKSA